MARAPGTLSPVRIAVIDAVRGGHRTVNALAAALGVTDNAVRLQLSALERDGLLRRRGVLHSGKAGQPAAEYELTDEGEDTLSQAYQPVLVALVCALSSRLPPRTARAIFTDAARRVDSDVKVSATAPLAARAASCAALIESLGGRATVSVSRNQAILQGDGCPLAAAVRAEPGTCFIVESLLEQHTGVRAIQLCQHGPNPRCRFQLEPR